VPLDTLSADDQNWLAQAPAPILSLPVDSTVAQAAARIDQLIDEMLVKKGIAPNPPAPDDVFVRRAYLDIAGRIPTLTETRTFLDNKIPTKRSQLIRDLLNSEGHISHLYNYFADMLRVREPDGGGLIKVDPYVQWLKEQIRSNRPYNEVVSELLTASGKMWSQGATGYLLRDSGMLLDNIANTFSIFLGTDVACAQCHDHPFSDWTQMQFYEMAAFFGATITQNYNGDQPDPVDRIMKELTDLAASSGGDVAAVEGVRGLLGDIVNANRYEVRDIKENRLRLPHDYKYKDGKPGEPVKPKFIRWSGEDRFIDAYKQNLRKEERLRQSFADWLTHPTNPRFSITIANRMWKRAFGVGAGEPVRSVDDPNLVANPRLLRHLGQEMVRLNFRLKDFMEVVYNTRAWQRSATTREVGMGQPYHFEGPLLRRMTAEQTWDAFMTLVLGEIDAKKPDTTHQLTRAIDLDIDQATGRLVASKIEGFRRVEEMVRNQMGGDLAMAGMSGGEGRVLQYGGMQLLRAADLPQPAPEGHFLREFGQSNRELIDGGHASGSVPQVLMLMNGQVQGMITHPDSLVMRALAAREDPGQRVDEAFLMLLSRAPTETERQFSVNELSDAGHPSSTANLVWALLTSLEFKFVQ